MAQMPMEAEGGSADMKEDTAEQAGMGPKELILGVNDGLSKLAAMLGKSQANPAAKKAIADALMSFQSGVEALMGGESGPVPMQGAAPMEAGASSKAVPAM